MAIVKPSNIPLFGQITSVEGPEGNFGATFTEVTKTRTFKTFHYQEIAATDSLGSQVSAGHMASL